MHPTSAMRAALAAAGICATLGLGALGSSTARASTDAPPDSQPSQYLIILDVSGSMVWNMDGEGTLGSGTDVNCVWSGPSQLTYREGCTGPTSAWHEENERRIYLAKQMISNLIDVMRPNDTMEIIAFSSGRGYTNNSIIAPANGWTSDQALLKANLLTVGSYNNTPYITHGGSANVQAILKAQSELASAPTTAPNGSSYRQVVMLVADGPASVFTNGIINTARDVCPDEPVSHTQSIARCHVGYSNTYNMERPITAMISAAAQLKQTYQVAIYTVAMANAVDDLGMAAVASSPSMAYTYTSPDLLAQIAASYP